MNHIGQSFRSKRKGYLKATSVVFLTCLVVTILCFKYYQHLGQTIQEESSGYLEEISQRNARNVDRIIDDHYAFLYMLENFVTTQNVDSIKDIDTYTNSLEKYWGFQNIMLVDSNGIGHGTNGQSYPLIGDVYLRETILNKAQSLSTLHTIDNQKSVIIAVPIENVSLDGKNIVAIAVSFETGVFEQVLPMTSINQKAFSLIINENGSPVISSTSAYSITIGNELLNTFKGSQIDKNIDFSKIKKDIKNNRSGQMGLKLDGKKVYMSYNPINSGEWYLLTFVPASVINGRSDTLLKTTLLIFSGIIIVFFILLLFLILSHRRHRLELEKIAYVDPITGGNTLQGFYKRAKDVLALSNRKEYALVYTNFINFKMLNELLGRNKCDQILHAFYESISANLTDKEIVGRVTADNFCVLLEYQNTQNLLTRLDEWYSLAIQNVEKHIHSQWVHSEMEFGIYVIENNTVPFPQMIDRAKLALREALAIHTSKLRYALYDDNLRCQLLREKQIENMMEDALKNREFQVYLQPKYSLPDERMIGAEALTRWISESEGMIYPDEFIPLFEKNGFIIKLDLWIFEEVCRMIRDWIDAEREPIKVSINCSRIHFKKPDFFKEYVKIAKIYNVPENLIEFELTESLVLDNMQQFVQIVEEIRKAGFSCSVDDFGSGYSSLNLIKEIHVDTLKLDKVFFRNSTQDSKRAEYVISSIISMAKALSMETVAEGVEVREQVDMLKRLGCDYIQGYVFAKPMPIKEFEQHL